MRKIFILLLLTSVLSVSGQVGINIVPLSSEAFHIDAKSNNQIAPAATAYLDDVVVDNTGNVGIGTNLPQAKLDVKTTVKGKVFRLVDGNERAGRVLLSDNVGVAHWGDPQNMVMYAKCPVSLDGIQVKYYVSTGEYSGRSLTLTKGSWLIKYSINWMFPSVSTNIGFIDVYLARNTTGTPDIVDGTWVITPLYINAEYASTQNSVIYTVTAASETLYMWTYFNNAMRSSVSSIGGGNNTFEAIRWQ